MTRTSPAAAAAAVSRSCWMESCFSDGWHCCCFWKSGVCVVSCYVNNQKHKPDEMVEWKGDRESKKQDEPVCLSLSLSLTSLSVPDYINDAFPGTQLRYNRKELFHQQRKRGRERCEIYLFFFWKTEFKLDMNNSFLIWYRLNFDLYLLRPINRLSPF